MWWNGASSFLKKCDTGNTRENMKKEAQLGKSSYKKNLCTENLNVFLFLHT